MIKRRLLVSGMIAMALVTLPVVSPPVYANKTLDAVAGGLIAAALIEAASKHHKHHKKFYHDSYQPYPDNGYDPYWNNIYSPAAGITCYRSQVACYKANGHFSAKWTRMQFADGE